MGSNNADGKTERAMGSNNADAWQNIMRLMPPKHESDKGKTKMFGKYIASIKKGIIGYVIAFAVLSVTFALYDLPILAVWYPMAITTAILLVLVVCDYRKVMSVHRELEQVKKQTAEMITTLPEPRDIIEEDYRTIVQSLCEEASATRTTFRASYDDMIDYYTIWAHQIKTPLASMRLAVANDSSDRARRLKFDLLRTEQYVDMVMTFLRLDSNSSDLVVKEYELDGIIRTSVKKFASEFIDRRLSMNFTPTNYKTITDEKWLSFVIEQIISNALKYTKEGSVTIAMNTPGMLSISDTGIGIAPEDLPRIFEKGYTGFNGRTNKEASGLGLYLCKRVLDKLGHTVSIESTVNVGTTVCIGLSRDNIKFE